MSAPTARWFGPSKTERLKFSQALKEQPVGYLGAWATADRPAATRGAGASYYDTTISKPVYSDGAVWKDAAGVAVP